MMRHAQTPRAGCRGALVRMAWLVALLPLVLWAPSGANAATVSVATANVNLRARPSTDFPVVTVVPQSVRIVTYGCTSDYAWCDIGFAGHRGWVASRYITAEHAGRTVVVGAATATAVGIGVVQFSRAYWDTYYAAYPWYGRWAVYVPPHAPHVVHRSAQRSCEGGTCRASVSTHGAHGGAVEKKRACREGGCAVKRTVTGPNGATGTMGRVCARGHGCTSVRRGHL
mgnify:CR=1 FL=1